MADPGPTRAERLGRRAAIAVFGVVVGGFTLINTASIIRQVWFLPPAEAATDCRADVLGLMAAVRRARGAAAEEVEGERAALASFQAALLPEWSRRAALEAACRDDALALRGLREVDRLRYAEEHSVRSEAVEVARLRRGVQRLELELGQGR